MEYERKTIDIVILFGYEVKIRKMMEKFPIDIDEFRM